MLRWPVMVPLNEVRGAVNGGGIAAPRRARMIQSPAIATVPGNSFSISSGRRTMCPKPSAASRTSLGARSGL